MLTKTKAKSALKMLITLFLTLALILGIYFAIPKQSTKVRADTIENSAVLAKDWKNLLASPVTTDNIVSIRITTDLSATNDFIKGKNVADSTSNKDLYYYYKLAGNNGTVDTAGYEIVIYANVEKIYAPVNSSLLFYDLTNCKSIIFDNFDTSNVTTMELMFTNISSLTSLDLTIFDTSNVTSMMRMIGGCSSLVTLNLSSFDTNNVTNMYFMFAGCQSLASLDLTNFSTSKVTNMGSMFSNCSSLTSLDVSNFNTSKVTSMNSMFYNCSSLKILDLSNFDMGKVTSASSILYGCSALEKIVAPIDLNGLSISLPSTYEYKDATGTTQTTDVLIAGATHTIPGYVEDPALSTGVISDSILICLIGTAVVVIGLVLLIIPKKRRKVRRI